jgi:hypothetical protein
VGQCFAVVSAGTGCTFGGPAGTDAGDADRRPTGTEPQCSASPAEIATRITCANIRPNDITSRDSRRSRSVRRKHRHKVIAACEPDFVFGFRVRCDRQPFSKRCLLQLSDSSLRRLTPSGGKSPPDRENPG